MVVIRIVLTLIASFTVFLVVFLAIFVPMAISNEHYAPHDGQNGMAAAFVGLPIAAIAALVATPAFYLWLKRSGRFSN